MSRVSRLRKFDLEYTKLAEDEGICLFQLYIGNEVENKTMKECQGPGTTMSTPVMEVFCLCGLKAMLQFLSAWNFWKGTLQSQFPSQL